MTTRGGLGWWEVIAAFNQVCFSSFTPAAVGFAGVLVFIMRSDEVRGFLLNLIRTALTLP